MDPEDERTAGAAVSAVVRRLVLRLIRPFTHHERELDRAIVEQLKRLDAEWARERRARERDRARLQELEARVAELGLGAADAQDERPGAGESAVAPSVGRGDADTDSRPGRSLRSGRYDPARPWPMLSIRRSSLIASTWAAGMTSARAT